MSRVIVDATDAILGRLASRVAKELLRGNRVDIVNAEKAVISGSRESIVETYRAWMETRQVANPRKGPKHPKYPEDIVRKAVRGMLPHEKPKGREAYRRLRVYRGVPEHLAGKEFIKIPEADAAKLGSKYIKVEELSRFLGARV
jgi:large subunit ribosomal protein L13